MDSYIPSRSASRQALPDAGGGRAPSPAAARWRTGRIERGKVKVGEEVEIVGPQADHQRRW